MQEAEKIKGLGDVKKHRPTKTINIITAIDGVIVTK